MTGPEVPRPDLDAALLERVRGGPPLLLTGPPGAGKTTLLLRTAAALRSEGWIPVYLDLMAAVSSPEAFVKTALGTLSAEAFGRELARATEIRRLADAGRTQADRAVHALFSLWASLDEADGRPVALLLDEATEIRSLAYFAGLRQVEKPFAAALARRRRGTLLATSFPSLARRLWSFDTIPTPPLLPTELAPCVPPGTDLEAIVRASFGWPRHVAVLLDRLGDGRGDDLVTAWASEMQAGGRLELGCRHTYDTLLLRSRGYGISKAVLAAVAHEEGLNLTALVARLGRTPGAIRDYLQWLVSVDALTVVKKRYYYVDGLVRWWVRLHSRGVPPTAIELLEAAREAAGLDGAATPETADELAEGPRSVGSRRDTLMEID